MIVDYESLHSDSYLRRREENSGTILIAIKQRKEKEQLMEKELFNPQSSSVSSARIIYTPSTFARTSLLHLQEVGSLQAVHPHVSQREDLVSFLCFIVLSGEGELSYEVNPQT